MSSLGIKTNNDKKLIETKVNIRIDSLPDKKEITVLDAFGGEGVLWSEVRKRCPDKTIKILSIDKQTYDRVQLQGDNVKLLLSLNLAEFDIIDLDSYGMPVKQLEIIFNKGYHGIVHCTFIQIVIAGGGLSHKILRANGYTDTMFKKCPSLFNRNGTEKFLNYLALNGVKWVKIVTIVAQNNKNYLYFSL